MPGSRFFDDFGHDDSTINTVVVIIITARCYASAVLAMGLCLSVCHKSVFYRNG